jgi:hypothetical protein
MASRNLNSLCYIVSLASLLAWAVLSCLLIWGDVGFFERSRSGQVETYSLVGKWWVTCLVVFITSALILRLNKTCFENTQRAP